MSWLTSVFEKKYAPYLDYGKRNHRQEGFRLIFSELEKMNKGFYRIVETGSTRKTLSHRLAWKDGMGTIMFEDFVTYYDGEVDTVDIDENVCNQCRSLVGNKVTVHCCDSLVFLKNIKDHIDFFYLDSWDVDRNNPTPSQQHHLNEFKIIEPYLKDSIVAIDDNFTHKNINVGKGKLVQEYLLMKDIRPLYNGYQLIYKF